MPARAQPHPIDVYVGARLRLARTGLDLTQEALAATIGVSFQQIQKYESGANRISASTLFRLSLVLRAPIDWFFEGYGKPPLERFDEPDAVRAFLATPDGPTLALMMASLPLVLRQRLVALIRASAPLEEGEDPT